MIRPRQSCLLLWIALVVCGQTAFAQDGSFTRDGVQLFYRTSGSGAPIIFLSGGPGFTVDYMVSISEFVPASYQRVFYEQRGTGRSKLATMITPGYFFERAKGLAFASQLPDGTLTLQVNALLFGDMSRGYDSRPGLRQLDRPVLIVQGHQDPVGDKTAEDIHAAIKSSALTYLNQCGHFPWLEQPDAFRRILTEFFQSK